MEIISALGRDWVWPEADRECRRVVFDWASDLNSVYPRCRKFDLAVQAGGNMGVWPWLLAKKFAKVITFEPDPVCYDALTQNLAHSPKIECHNMALMDAPGAVHMMNDEPDNLGAQYVAPMPHGIEATTIDALALPMCDLIYLDIEGAELPALQGAKATIKAFKPVVVVEDKGHSSRFGYKKGDSVQWLYQFGYFAVNRRHNDVVLMCKS